MVLFQTISSRRRGYTLSSRHAYTDDSAAAAITKSIDNDEDKYHISKFRTCRQTTSCKSILMIGAALALMTFLLLQMLHANFRPLYYLRQQNDSSGIQTQLTETILEAGSLDANMVAATTNEEEEASGAAETERVMDEPVASEHVVAIKEKEVTDTVAASASIEEAPPNLEYTSKLHHPILPTRVISVIGPESSGSTFLATTLAAAAGAGLGVAKKVDRCARTVDRKCEIQHLSLPWGWQCENKTGDEIAVNIVDAMVPGECFRYELAPSLDPVIAEQTGQSWRAGQQKGTAGDKGLQTKSEAQVLQQCRDEVFISEESNLSCGAKCGSGVHNGYALYPARFSVNITSHIEWYLQRGVDVTVVLATRDRSISKQGKEKLHCQFQDVGRREDEVALELMKEGLEKYGPFGSIERGRVIVSSYEALISMKNEFLFGLYKQLRINSTYLPSFIDGNQKYVTDANKTNLGNNEVATVSSSKYDISARQPKPKRRNYTNPKASVLLPKKLITVVGLEGPGSAFLLTTLGEAVSLDGEYGLQHISLPYGWTCESSESMIKANIVDALVPEACFGFEHKLKDLDPDPLNTRICQEEVRISENNKDESLQWSCGAKCGEGQFSGLALYPDSFYVNITSHIQWYLIRGVDVKVVLLLRDKTISNKEKLRSHHCHIPPEVADVEDDTAIEIMREAYQMYGEEERVMVVSYEGLMQFQQSYLFGIYKSLGIKSTYVPEFVDENIMFVAPDRQHQTLHKKGHDEDKRK